MASHENCCWIDKAKKALDYFTKGASKSWGHEEADSYKEFIVGGVVGGILGAVAGLLLAPKSGCDLRHTIADSCHHLSDRTCELADDFSKQGKRFAKTAYAGTNRWLNLAKNIIEEFTENAADAGHQFSDKAKDFSHDRLDEVMELASIGYKLWKKLKK